MIKQRWDIFCKIVDNFGDIGVCWRLARQLQLEHGLQIRLWIDDLGAAQKIIPNLNINVSKQVCDKITILKWPNTDKSANKADSNRKDEADFSIAAEVVIEAFSCGLPPAYLAAMVQQKSTVSKTKWINLEYLSAEPWVAGFHAKPSPQANGLTRYFYFPGFTDATGGLIRERDTLGSHYDNSRSDMESLKVSLFCYPHAPIHDLLIAMAESNQQINCYVPASSILPQITDFFGKETIDIGDNLSQKNLHVHVLPFLSQTDYDALLCDCDINFVRGEDSWVRAMWAGKPFIWQPYFQDENTHIKKLNAFLDLFYADLEAKQVVCEAHSAWVSGQLTNEVWQSYLDNLSAINAFTCQQSKKLAKLDDLAAKLVIFCNKIL